MSWVRVPPFRSRGREQMTASHSDQYRARENVRPREAGCVVCGESLNRPRDVAQAVRALRGMHPDKQAEGISATLMAVR